MTLGACEQHGEGRRFTMNSSSGITESHDGKKVGVRKLEAQALGLFHVYNCMNSGSDCTAA